MDRSVITGKPRGRKKITDDKFIVSLASRSGLSVEEARKFWDAQKDVIAEEINSSGTLRIPGFGTFYRLEHKGHPMNLRNIAPSAEGDSMQIGDYALLKFTADHAFRDRVVGAPIKQQAKT